MAKMASNAGIVSNVKIFIDVIFRFRNVYEARQRRSHQPPLMSPMVTVMVMASRRKSNRTWKILENDTLMTKSRTQKNWNISGKISSVTISTWLLLPHPPPPPPPPTPQRDTESILRMGSSNERRRLLSLAESVPRMISDVSMSLCLVGFCTSWNWYSHVDSFVLKQMTKFCSVLQAQFRDNRYCSRHQPTTGTSDRSATYRSIGITTSNMVRQSFIRQNQANEGNTS